jgi:predicted component of type VI protein secretion system
MTAEDDQLNPNKPYLLTFKGQVTVYFIDGQTLTGEITAQDAFNIFLTVEGVPHLVSRSQIRYIKGEPTQAIETETPSTVLVEAQPSPQPTPPVSAPEPESVAEVAYFVDEEETAPPEEDTGGTLVIPPAAVPPVSAVADTDIHQPISDELDEAGETIVLTPEVETTAGGVTPVPVSAGDTGLAAPPEDEDATFVLAQDEEIFGHLVCTTGPHAGEVFQLKPAITTIGRSSDNPIPLSKDKEVSRRHAIIAYEASKFVIQDQNSLNGTLVNNELIKEPHPLEDGDIILIGVSTLKFQEHS